MVLYRYFQPFGAILLLMNDFQAASPSYPLPLFNIYKMH